MAGSRRRARRNNIPEQVRVVRVELEELNSDAADLRRRPRQGIEQHPDTGDAKKTRSTASTRLCHAAV
jgi:uncharacterized coiled-coil DUF342 family protein